MFLRLQDDELFKDYPYGVFSPKMSARTTAGTWEDPVRVDSEKEDPIEESDDEDDMHTKRLMAELG